MKKNILLSTLMLVMVAALLPTGLFAQDTETDSVCHYRLFTECNNNGWRGGSVELTYGSRTTGAFFDATPIHITLTHSGSEDFYLDIPTNSWIHITHQNIPQFYERRGHFILYDENDSVIFEGPQNLPASFLWWNGCSLDIPDAVSLVAGDTQGNTVNLSWTNPTHTVNGDTLTIIPRVDILRNEEMIHSFTDVPSGTQMSYSDQPAQDGTYQYTIQCFNEAGAGVPVTRYFVCGQNLTMFNYSHNTTYTDTTCAFSITSDNAYTVSGHAVITVCRGDSSNMWRLSGYNDLDSNVTVTIQAGEGNNLITLEPGNEALFLPHKIVTFTFDIPAGSSPVFSYTLECVDTLYEQPDTTIAILPDTNGIIYVTETGAGLKNGSSWNNATPWLNRALEAADTMATKPVIWVAKGTYYGNPQLYDNDTYAFVGRAGVNVYGGFAGNEPADYNLSLRDFDQNETVLDGLQEHTVLYLNGCEWNGFHIQRGVNGCVMKESSLLRKCTVTECLQDGVYSRVMSVNYPPSVDSCYVSYNTGNGINSRFLNISNTEAAFNGHYGVLSSGNVDRCIITNNTNTGYYSDYSISSRRFFKNSIVANNGGDGCRLTSNYILLNSTVVNNSNVGIILVGNCQLKNSIVWGNNVSIQSNREYEISFCAVDGYIHSSNFNIPLSSINNPGGIQPGFVNPTAGAGSAYSGGDWHLLPTSVCINRGSATVDNLPETDLEGNARIRQGIPDIGAYESDYTLVEENHFIHPDTNKIIYVKEEGTGDGSSWQNATSDLSQAIELAWLYGPNTQIWVAQGTYPTPNTPFYLKENLKLFGGFEGNEPADYPIDLRNTMEHPSVLNGQNHNRVLHQTIDFGNGALVEGFTLTNGTADEGAGAYLMAGTTFSKCRIANNMAGENGAALHANLDSLKQLLVANNNGNGIVAENTHLIHCTVVRNSGYGLVLSVATGFDSCLLCNSVLWGNGQENLYFTSAATLVNTSAHHCAIENQIVAGVDNVTLSVANIGDAGPHFVLPNDTVGAVNTLGDWQLDSSSLCVNAGTELSGAYGILTDLAGQPRVQNGSADIGALESLHKGLAACRTMEISICEGETYLFYDTTLATSGWYEHRWNVGEMDSVVTLRLTVRHIMYVSVEGAGSKDGTSWANALDGGTATENGSTKLADALAEAAIGTDFWIQSGTYYACSDSDVNKSFVLNEGVGLYGGFTGTESTLNQRDTNNAPTVFSGNLQNDSIMENYSRNIFKTHELNTLNNPIILNQVAIKEGYNNLHTGSALHIGSTSEIRAERCRFYHNFGSAVSNEGRFTGCYCKMDSNISFSIYGISYSFSTAEHHSYHEGAGALTNKSSAVSNLKCCKILNNSAPHDGAIFNMGIMSIDSTDISYNNASSNHTGAIFNKCLLTITNSIMSYNWAYYGVSTIFSDGILRMYNCSVDSNQSAVILPDYYFPQGLFPSLGAVACHILTQGEAEIENCVFSRNDQNGIDGGGCIHVKGYANVKNCGFLDNYGGMDFKPGGQGGMLQIVYVHTGLDGCVFVKSGSVEVEGCVFDRDYGGGGTAAAVESGELSINRCVFTRNNQFRPGAHQEGILAIKSGELHVQNSLFANNQNTIFNTAAGATITSTSFTNCTLVNNGDELCIFNYPAIAYREEDIDFSQVAFHNSVIVGSWETKEYSIGSGGTTYYPNWNLQFTNTLFDTLRVGEDALLPAANISPDSAGNIYYCNPMFVNPTVMLGIDTLSDWSQVDFRLREGSPCINSGVLEGTGFTEDETDLAGERRVKQCVIDRGCYEFGSTVFADTLFETLCMEANSVEGFVYTGHGFTIPQPEVGTSIHSRNSACEDTVYTLSLDLHLISRTEDYLEDCDSVVWHDNFFTESGEYVRTIPGSTGCDSIVTLHVTVHHSVTEPVEVTICEDELPYHYMNGAIDTTFDIGTPNLSTFNFSLSTQYGCDSTVALTLIVEPCDTTGIATYDGSDIILYPNPTTGIVTVRLSPEIGNLTPEIHLFDIYGRRLSVVGTRCTTSLQSVSIDLSNYATGIYLVKLVNGGRVVATGKVVKQ